MKGRSKFRGPQLGEVRNPMGIGLTLPGEVRNPNGYFGTSKQSLYAMAVRHESSKRYHFKPGNCLNPYGSKGKPGPKMKKRKRILTRSPEALSIVKEQREITDLAKRSAPAALKALDNIIKSKLSSDMAKIAAAHAVLDRGYGKATQVNVNENRNADGPAQEVDGSELDRRIGEALTRVESITGRTRKKIKSEDGPTDIRFDDRNTGGTGRLN